MKDAVGGIVNIWFIALFIVIVSGYLAFSVQYNKAFRMKNEIIEAIEQCEGKIDDCADELITQYKIAIGYNVASDWTFAECQTGGNCTQGDGYWIKEVPISNSSELGQQVYYTVATAVNTDIPVFRNIIPNMSIFQVSGNTRRITKH